MAPGVAVYLVLTSFERMASPDAAVADEGRRQVWARILFLFFAMAGAGFSHMCWQWGWSSLAGPMRSQLAALWGTIAWATTQPQLRGLIVGDAADYERISGLRATGGRLRPAAGAVAAAVRLLRETVMQ